MIVIAIFLLVRLKITFQFYSLLFDGSIYIGQAKYLYSFGAIGYFEPLRPIVVPLLLGIGWITGLDIVAWGKFVEILLSSGAILLTYIIGSRLHNRIAGTLSAALLGITPVFFLYSDKILTGIPSAFFALLSFYFFMNKKYWLTGLFAAVAFMTRFPQGIVLIAYLLVFSIMFLQAKKRKIVCLDFVRFIVPYSVVVLSFLIFNAIKYRAADTVIEAMFWPFVHGSTTIATSGLWLYSGTLGYYFVQLIKQNYLLIFSLVFIYFFIAEKKYLKLNFNFLLIVPVLFLAYFTYLQHKEVRFALVFLAYIAVMSGIAIAKIYEYVANKKRLLILFFAVLLILIYLLKLPKPSMQEFVSPMAEDVCFFVKEYNYKGPVMLTTPYPLHCLDNRIELNLFSIPLLLNTTRDNPDWLLIFAPGTFPCQENDTICNEQKTSALNKFRNNYQQLYLSNETAYPIYVFKKVTSS
jgi:hypothetical protein